MSASAISGCDTSPVFEFREYIFRLCVIVYRGFYRRERKLCGSSLAGLYTFVSQSVPEPVSIIAAIGAWQCIQKNFSPFVITPSDKNIITGRPKPSQTA